MSDLISRAAAIDAVVGCTNCRTEDELRAYVTKHYLDNGWTGGIVDALDVIEQLPSAQPEHTSNNDCNGCKFVGCYDTCFPCANCVRRDKDYYETEG